MGKSKGASNGKLGSRCPYSGGVGYATAQGRVDWMRSQGLPETSEITEDVQADLDPKKPLYYWQLYSLLGPLRIEDIVRRFYTRVYDDDDDPDFRKAFTRISAMEHHVQTQTAFWVDVMGGGPAYHGGDYRLNFHHTNNAASVLNAKGAARWMFHMGNTLKEVKLNMIDIRIKPCLVEFLRTKMKKYAKEHKWKFDNSGFDFVNHDPELVALRKEEFKAVKTSDLQGFGVKALKEFLTLHDKEYSNCREKSELLALAQEVVDEPDGDECTNDMEFKTSKDQKTAGISVEEYILKTSQEEIEMMDVKELKAFLQSKSVDYFGCFEKNDLRKLALSAATTQS